MKNLFDIDIGLLDEDDLNLSLKLFFQMKTGQKKTTCSNFEFSKEFLREIIDDFNTNFSVEKHDYISSITNKSNLSPDMIFDITTGLINKKSKIGPSVSSTIFDFLRHENCNRKTSDLIADYVLWATDTLSPSNFYFNIPIVKYANHSKFMNDKILKLILKSNNILQIKPGIRDLNESQQVMFVDVALKLLKQYSKSDIFKDRTTFQRKHRGIVRTFCYMPICNFKDKRLYETLKAHPGCMYFIYNENLEARIYGLNYLYDNQPLGSIIRATEVDDVKDQILRYLKNDKFTDEERDIVLKNYHLFSKWT